MIRSDFDGSDTPIRRRIADERVGHKFDLTQVAVEKHTVASFNLFAGLVGGWYWLQLAAQCYWVVLATPEPTTTYDSASVRYAVSHIWHRNLCHCVVRALRRHALLAGSRKIEVNLNFNIRALQKVITSARGSLKPSIEFKLLFHVPTFITWLNLTRRFQRVLSNLTTGRRPFKTRRRSKTRKNQNAKQYS